MEVNGEMAKQNQQNKPGKMIKGQVSRAE